MKNLSDHFYNIEKFPINSNKGEGFEFELDDKKYITKGSYDKEYPEYRKATLSITSYRGFGGIHFYGNITIGVLNANLLKPSNTISGSLGGIVLPDEYKTIKFEVIRPLILSDIEKEPERWETYIIGEDKTNGFYNEEEIIDIVCQLKDKIFKGKWVLFIDGYNTDDQKIIINN